MDRRRSRPTAFAPRIGVGGGVIYMDRQVVPTDTDAVHLAWAFCRIGEAPATTASTGLADRGLLDRLVEARPGSAAAGAIPPSASVRPWTSGGWRRRAGPPVRLRGDASPGTWISGTPTRRSGADLVQTAWFKPRGVLGRLYWYGMLPRTASSPRMARGIAAAAEERGYAVR
jgi:hypothetical protein